MKYTGIVRKLDNLGRIVLPSEMRKVLNLSEYDEVEMLLENDAIVVRKYAPTCTLCGQGGELTDFHGRSICANCLAELRSLGK